MEVIFLGTIDKQYPNQPGAYAFMIGDPVVSRILDTYAPGLLYKAVTVCQKDSQDITEDDRLVRNVPY